MTGSGVQTSARSHYSIVKTPVDQNDEVRLIRSFRAMRPSARRLLIDQAEQYARSSAPARRACLDRIKGRV
jgi:hypothetical protein